MNVSVFNSLNFNFIKPIAFQCTVYKLKLRKCYYFQECRYIKKLSDSKHTYIFIASSL